MNDSGRKFNSFEVRAVNLAPLLDAPIAVRIHVAAVVPAALIGPYLFWARKGMPIHRLLGKVWLGLMVVAALSSFFVHSINLYFGFSPIHLLSAYVLLGSWLAYRAARQHRIRDHKRQVVGLYMGGIVGAGLFTLLPGRIMHDVAFSRAENAFDLGRLWVFLAWMAGVVLCLLLASGYAAHMRRERI